MLSKKRTRGTHSDPGPSSPRCSAKTKSSDFTLSSHIYKILQLFPAAGVGLMGTSAGDSHHKEPSALSGHFWYNLWPDSVPSPPKPNRNYIVPSLPPPLQSLFLMDSTVTVTITTATTTQPGLFPPGETQAKVWQREKGKGIFLRHNSLGFPHQGTGILVGAAPRPGWAVDPTEERGMEGATQGKQCWDGEQQGAPTGVHLSQGKQLVWGPGSRTTSACQGQEGS